MTECGAPPKPGGPIPAPGAQRGGDTQTSRDLQLLSSFNHDARTPLSAILGAFQLLGRADIPPAQRNLAEAGRRAVMQLLHCLDNFVEYNRSQAGAVAPQLAPEPLEVFTITWTQRLQETIDTYNKDLEGEVSAAPGLPECIQTDAHYLNLVMDNLFDNAVRYADSGRVSVRIAAPAPGQIAFDVTDTGPGIAVEQRGHLFRSGPSGPGPRRITIGLPLAAMVADLLGGSLDLLQSGPEGSTFRLVLPAGTSHQLETPDAA